MRQLQVFMPEVGEEVGEGGRRREGKATRRLVEVEGDNKGGGRGIEGGREKDHCVTWHSLINVHVHVHVGSAVQSSHMNTA